MVLLTVAYSFYFIFSTFFLIITGTTVISPMFVFGSNGKSFKEFGISLSSVLFSFSLVFLSFVSFFLVAAHKKDSFKLRIDQNVSAHIDVIEICSC